ncbi:hypothetical protein TNCV_36081 [Trichonephila clavipes]|nr:hypothetical protein TNCV_36081 [Trichonephila clavipes]
MFKRLRIDIFERQETKLPVRLIKATHERRLVLGHETTPLRVKGAIEDVYIGPTGFKVGRPVPFTRVEIRYRRGLEKIDLLGTLRRLKAESLSEPDEISNLIEEVVNLTRQINTGVDSDDIQGPLDFHNQKFDNG